MLVKAEDEIQDNCSMCCKHTETDSLGVFCHLALPVSHTSAPSSRSVPKLNVSSLAHSQSRRQVSLGSVQLFCATLPTDRLTNKCWNHNLVDGSKNRLLQILYDKDYATEVFGSFKLFEFNWCPLFTSKQQMYWNHCFCYWNRGLNWGFSCLRRNPLPKVSAIKTQQNQLKMKRLPNPQKSSMHAIRWEVLIVLCTSQLLPACDLFLTSGRPPLKEVKDFCCAALGSRWSKDEVIRGSESRLCLPQSLLSPPSLQHTVVISACDLFTENLFFLKVFPTFPSTLFSPLNSLNLDSWKY